MESASVLIFCRWAIGLTFAVSAVGKAASMPSFRDAITDFAVVPARLRGAAAVAAVGSEGLAAAGVAAGGDFASAGFALALALLAVFSAALAVVLRKKAKVSCNCFGSSERQVSWYDLGRNAVLGTCCAVGLWDYRAAAGGHLALGLVLVLGLMAAGLVIVTTNLEDIVELLRKPYLFE